LGLIRKKKFEKKEIERKNQYTGIKKKINLR